MSNKHLRMTYENRIMGIQTIHTTLKAAGCVAAGGVVGECGTMAGALPAHGPSLSPLVDAKLNRFES